MGLEIQRIRALLTYAIVTRLTVDVGRVINREMKAVCEGRSNRVLEFPVLITQLCQLAGVDVSSDDPTNVINLHPKITSEMYIPGRKEKAPRWRQRAED